MPSIYISPSTQENNLFVNGGTEEQYMNLIADDLTPYLRSSGISYSRNTPDMTAASSIRAANQGDYDLYLAIHSNAAPEGRYGSLRGSIAFYYPTSTGGRRFADLIVEQLKQIYPDPALVRSTPITTLGEVRQPNAPAVLVEVAYHDNSEDATWIKNNIPEIAEALARAITDYFGLPLVPPMAPVQGRVQISWGHLNLRRGPSVMTPIVGRLANNQPVTIVGQYDGWYVVYAGGLTGYAAARFIVRES